jgi:hypothetical protein
VRRRWSRLRALVALAGLCAACAHASPPVQDFGHCSADVAAKATPYVGEVMSDLATQNYADLLDTLALKVGAPEALCAVDLAIAELNSMHAASPDKTVATMLTRARAWRGAH